MADRWYWFSHVIQFAIFNYTFITQIELHKIDIESYSISWNQFLEDNRFRVYYFR